MNDLPDPAGDHRIRSFRGPKNKMDPFRPYHYMMEKERSETGRAEEVITIFLTNKECRFKCLMCDLWKNTTDTTVPVGAIPGQIRWALDRLPNAPHLKLYNSSNFFDPGAVPVEDYPQIAELLSPFQTVIVENHPNLTGERCTRFAEMIKPRLQVALGLETIHPLSMERMNKKMTPGDYRRAVEFLRENGISTRTFVLLNPPFTKGVEGVEWAIKTLRFAFESGTDCCTVIPVRPGNGAVEYLRERGHYSKPDLSDLEKTLQEGISLGMGPVFADTWDLEQFSVCPDCFEARAKRLERMNLEQRNLPPAGCHCSPND